MNFTPKNIIFSIISASVGIIVFAICVMVVFHVGSMGYDFGYQVFSENPVSEGLGRSVLVEIKKGMTDDDVASVIHKAGLVNDKNVFFLQIKMSEYSKKYIPGSYMLSTNMTPTEILAKICSGETYMDEPKTEEQTTGAVSDETIPAEVTP